LAALHFRQPTTELLRSLRESEWREALVYCDRSQLTLPLADAAADWLPDWVRRRVDEDARKNCVRVRAIEQLYRDIAACLDAAGLEFLALKGLAHCELFGALRSRRVQYDIDLYVPPESVNCAAEALRPLGFEPIEGLDDSPTDHLPALIRKTGWEWRGDFFDPEIPVSLELHFQFWNEEFEALSAPRIGEFWGRRVRAVVGGAAASVLRPADAFGYAAMHLLRHVLRGSVKPFHVYELARFLQLHEADETFWSEWASLHDPGLKQLEAVACRLAEAWFGCAVPREIAEEFALLPRGTQRWFESFARSPATGLFRSNKDELWLHLSLLQSGAPAWRIARQRLLPLQLPGPVYAVHVPKNGLTARMRLEKHARYAAFLASRLRHHVAVLPRVAMSAMRWRWG
jgi:hypothetical protein